MRVTGNINSHVRLFDELSGITEIMGVNIPEGTIERVNTDEDNKIEVTVKDDKTVQMSPGVTEIKTLKETFERVTNKTVDKNPESAEKIMLKMKETDVRAATINNIIIDKTVKMNPDMAEKENDMLKETVDRVTNEDNSMMDFTTIDH